MSRIFLDPGHGGEDPGASRYGLREKDLTLEIAKRIQKYLNDNYTGHTIKLSRTTDKYLTLTQRTNMANTWGADFFMSIHINAGGGTGYEDFIYNTLSDSSSTAKMRDIAHAENAKEQSFWRNRGKKKANFAVLRQTKMPAMLTENGFIDTKSDADKLKLNAYLDKIAKGHAVGLAKILKLKKKAKPAKKEDKPVTKKSNTPDSWAKKDVEEAKNAGITDGSRLHDVATRQEVIVMMNRLRKLK